jgi:hypothetical protein
VRYGEFRHRKILWTERTPYVKNCNVPFGRLLLVVYELKALFILGFHKSATATCSDVKPCDCGPMYTLMYYVYLTAEGRGGYVYIIEKKHLLCNSNQYSLKKK